MYAKQNWTFVRIVVEVPLAVVYGAIAASGPDEHRSLWRRPSAGAWEGVAVSGDSPKIDPNVREVWAVGAELWVLAWDVDRTAVRPVLLRTGPVGTEWVAPPPQGL